MRYEYQVIHDMKLTGTKDVADALTRFSGDGWEPVMMLTGYVRNHIDDKKRDAVGLLIRREKKGL